MGSIPALSTLPDCAPLAWAEQNSPSSDTSEITDPEIKNLDYAYKEELFNTSVVGRDTSFNRDSFVDKDGGLFNFDSFFDDLLSQYKKALSSYKNKYLVEIPVKGNYTAIKNSNTDSDHTSFYSFLNSVSENMLIQPDVRGNTLSRELKSIFNANSLFLNKYEFTDDSSHKSRGVYFANYIVDTSAPQKWSLDDRYNYGYASLAEDPLKDYYLSSPINADVKQENFQHMHITSGMTEESMNYKKYSLLPNESKRISKKRNIICYRVQLNVCVSLEDIQEYYNGTLGWSREDSKSAQQDHMYALGIDLPLHTRARLVKDVDVEKPQNRIALSSETTLTEDDKTAIKNAYKEQYVAAFSKTNDNYDAGELRKKVAGGEVYIGQDSSDGEYYVYIKVDGIKGQKVKMKDIYQSLDGAKTAAKDAISKLKNLTPEQSNAAPGEVDSAKSQVAIDTVVAKYTLQDKINAANALKDKDTYNKATDKTTFDNALKNATEKLQDKNAKAEDLTQATTDLDTAIKALDGDLNVAKEEAKPKIAALNNLSKEEKKGYTDQIDKAKTKRDVNDIVTKATNANNQTLEDAKKAGKKEIDDLENLDKTTKDQFKSDIDKKTTKPEITEVVNQAKAKDLPLAKDKAKKAIDALPNLKDEEKKAFDKQVDDAPDATKVADILSQAKKQNSDRDSHSNPFGFPLPEGYGTSSSSDAATKPEDTKKFATTPLYRLYNPWTGEHLFTTDAEEHEHLARVDWKDEGVTGKVATKEGKPVHRLYNPTTGEHHYTPNADELKACIAAGWKDEGVHFYSNGDKPVYSMYNPYEQSFYHHYTSNKEEIAKMVKDGWKNEGVKWYCAGDDE